MTMGRAMLISSALWALVSGCSGSCTSSEPGAPALEDATPAPPPEPEPAHPMVRTPPAAPKPSHSIGVGPDITYPERVPLFLAPGVEAITPPMRVQVLSPIPDRRLAVASGKIASGPAVELIDVENATILWRDIEACSGQIVHTSADRVICAGWKGTVALDVDSGRPAWESTLIFRAAGQGYLVARDATQVTVGEILDVATGRTVTRVQMPEGYDLEEVHYLCADSTGFDMFSWSPAGELRRFRLGRREEIVLTVWSRRLHQEPSRLDPCDPVILVETPIPGRDVSYLRALGRKKGISLGNRIEVNGWWLADSEGDIAVSTPAGLALHDRRLGNIRALSSRPLGDEQIASWAGLRMLRTVDGTALIVGERGISHWLAAPAHAAQAVITPTHVLAGPWRGRTHSGAENLALYRMEKGLMRSFESAPAPAPPTKPLTSASLTRMPKTESGAAITVAFPHPGEYTVARVALAGEELYIAADKGTPRPGRGAGITVFDLKSRSFGWYQEQACAANAEVVGIAISEHAIVCAAREHFPGPGMLHALARDSGAPMWSLKLATVDDVIGAGRVIVAMVGDRAVVIDARSGDITFELLSDNGHSPRVVLIGERVIAVESGGLVVARELDGTPVWSVTVRGYVRDLRPLSGAVAVHTHAGELFLINAADGKPRPVDSESRQWKASGGGDLAFDSARGRQGELILWAYDAQGRERFRASYPTIIEWDPAPLRASDPDAPVLLVSRQPEPRLLQLDPRNGRVMSRHLAPENTYRQGVFSALVDQQPMAGVVLSDRLAVQVYRQY